MSKPLTPEITAWLERAAAAGVAEPQVLRNLLERVEALEALQGRSFHVLAADARAFGTKMVRTPEAAPVATPAQGPAPDSPAESLAARPLLEQVAAMADCIGDHTVGGITTISDRAAAWLRENPPGQPVAIEPRGCPTPGACSCVVPTTPPAPEVGELGELGEVAELVAALKEPGDQFPEYRTIASEQADRIAALLQQQQHLPGLAGAEPDRMMEQQAAPAPAVVPVAVPVAVEALTRLYWWGGMSASYGFSADVVLGVRDWINGGMAGDLPPLPAWIADRCPSLLPAGEVEA